MTMCAFRWSLLRGKIILLTLFLMNFITLAQATPIHLPSWTYTFEIPTLRPKNELLSTVRLGHILRSKISDTITMPPLLDFSLLIQYVKAQAPHRRNGLMIVGDSLSATNHFLRCMNHSQGPKATSSKVVMLSVKQDLESIFHRDSYAAQHGATTWAILNSKPVLGPKGDYGHHRFSIQGLTQLPKVPLLRELYDHQVRYASVLLGTNDAYYHKGLTRFVWRYIQLVESILDAGVIPIIQTIPPQRSPARLSKSLIQTFNHAIKAIANIERVPLLDLHTPLSKLKNLGLRKDGIHLNAYAGGCRLNQKGLNFGHNLRNDLFLKAYHEVKSRYHQQAKMISRTYLSKELISKVTQSSSVLHHSHPCWSTIIHQAKKAYRWRRIRQGHKEVQSDFHGPPMEAYGTWLIHESSFSTTTIHNAEVLSFLSPGAKRDLSREQMWISFNDGRCIPLTQETQSINFPSGTHQFIHLTRLTPSRLSKRDPIPTQPIPYGRALLAW
jgi:hypothetical protein